MSNCERKIRYALALTASVASGVATAYAQDLEPAICAVEQVIACVPFEACERTLPGAVNLPVLMRIEPGEKIIVSRREDGSERRSEAHTVSSAEDRITIQGIDGGEPWGMWVDRVTGRFTLATAGPGEAFSAFGVCTARLLK